MVNQVTNKKEIEVDNVTVGDFPLMKMPVAYQLTIHINNMLNTYNKSVIAAFKEYLYNPEKLSDERGYAFGTRAIINHYGVDACRKWFVDIYGWDFEKKAG